MNYTRAQQFGIFARFVAPVNDGVNVFCNSFFWNGMEILVNGTPREVGDGFSIANLIEDMALTDKRIAVEVNLGIVPRSQHGTHILQPGDRVEIVHAIGGG